MTDFAGESNVEKSVAIRLDRIDSEFRLTQDYLRSLRPALDVSALEQLIAHIKPQYRSGFLRLFHKDYMGYLHSFDDPVLNTLLEKVYAPFWADLSDEELGEILQGTGQFDVPPGVRGEVARRIEHRKNTE